jgi:hypothetical protein
MPKKNEKVTESAPIPSDTTKVTKGKKELVTVDYADATKQIAEKHTEILALMKVIKSLEGERATHFKNEKGKKKKVKDPTKPRSNTGINKEEPLPPSVFKFINDARKKKEFSKAKLDYLDGINFNKDSLMVRSAVGGLISDYANQKGLIAKDENGEFFKTESGADSKMTKVADKVISTAFNVDVGYQFSQKSMFELYRNVYPETTKPTAPKPPAGKNKVTPKKTTPKKQDTKKPAKNDDHSDTGSESGSDDDSDSGSGSDSGSESGSDDSGSESN